MASKTRVYTREYRVLQDTADKLRGGVLDDIDEVLATVERAAKAHRACRERLDAVERLLAEEE